MISGVENRQGVYFQGTWGKRLVVPSVHEVLDGLLTVPIPAPARSGEADAGSDLGLRKQMPHRHREWHRDWQDRMHPHGGTRVLPVEGEEDPLPYADQFSAETGHDGAQAAFREAEGLRGRASG